MSKKRWIMAICLACAALIGVAQQHRGLRIVFSNTDVSQVYKAISLMTGANIVYAGPEKLPITVHVQAATTEEAVKSVTSAAGLTYRRVVNTFVIAKPDGIRQALEPFSSRVRFSLVTVSAEDAAKRLQDALPMVTARPAGRMVLVTALPEDIVAARDILADFEKQALQVQAKTAMMTLAYASASQVATMVGASFPGLKITALGPPNVRGGVLSLSGPQDLIDGAMQAIKGLDQAGNRPDEDMAYEVYSVKYCSAPVLKEFIEAAIPEIKAIVGPEFYSPMQPQFRTITGNSIGNNSGGSGTSGSGLGGGANMGSTGSGTTGGSGLGAGGGSGTSQPFQRVKEGDRAKTLVLRGPASAVAVAMRMLPRIDVRPQQVRVDVKVVDTSPERADNVGIDYNWSPFSFFEVPFGTKVSDATNVTRPAGFGQFSRVPWDFGATISALITRKEAKLLANPSITVIDNDDANIFIGDTIRARIAQATGFGAQTVDIREFPIGIILLLRPRVNADGNITMRVHPVVSTITSIDQDNIPQTSAREAETTVMMRDGETVVIGGLIRDEFTRTTRELPILGQLPILGELFKSRTTNHRKSDILVFITTTIVTDEPAPGKKN